MSSETTAVSSPALERSAGPPTPPAGEHEILIQPDSAWAFIDWKELRDYRDLLWFLTWRDVKVRYAQSALGIGWAIIQPVFSMLIFTIVFGRMARIGSDGVPYAIFSFAALVPWTYFSNALNESSQSLVNQAQLISKVYFPRVVLPFAAVFAKLVDFSIAMILLFGMMAWFHKVPNAGILMLPMLVLIMVVTASGLGMWLTALAIQFRDVKHAMSFLVQLFMYATPVIYSTSEIPQRYQLLYALNPLVGVIEGFRSALLGTRAMPWDLIAMGAMSSLLIFISGAFYFRRKEQIFADVA